MAIFVGGLCLLTFAVQSRFHDSRAAPYPPMSYRDDGGHSPPPAAGIRGLGGNAPHIDSIGTTISPAYARDVYTGRRALAETADAGTRLLDMFLAIIGSVTVFCGEFDSSSAAPPSSW